MSNEISKVVWEGRPPESFDFAGESYVRRADHEQRIAALARQLAEAKAEADQWERDYNALSDRMLQLMGHAQQAEIQLAKAARRLAEAEGLLRRWAALDAGAWNPNRYERDKSELTIATTAALQQKDN